ncbi:hypothetical protein MNBD_NITROSPINAE02-1682 [hydrothermal vent metagenome]|uniref:YeeE/YedE family protein n=1 Tax=hydrothermal vent metagenome TaxID=652676 RepID=A0A3B1C4M6_9ZZZZ
MEIWKALFKWQWSPLVGGVLIGFVNTMMFAYDSPWAVYSGLRNWGLHVLEYIPGIGDVAQISPLEHKSSVMDIAFFLGAFAAALLAKEFAVRIPPLREAVKGIIGGGLMGVGAKLAGGCTIGGFYSSIAALSASGIFMMLGLFVGAVAGIKILMWEKRVMKSPPTGGKLIAIPHFLQVTLGVVALVAGIIAIPYYYDSLDFNELGVLFSFAMILGITNQRSRFCFVRAIREPFLTGDGEMTKAAALAFVVAIIGFTVIKYADIQDSMVFVAFTAGWPAALGGLIFGIGMTLAGGCASGSIWRAGEGHIKLWLAVISFALSAAAAHLLLELTFNFTYLKRVFLPDVWDSWLIALAIPLLIMFVWSSIAAWNEKTEKLTLL